MIPRFVAVISDFDSTRDVAVRAFHYVDTARFWVSQIHAYLYEGTDDDFVTSAELYKLKPNGECELIDEYSGYDRGDGLAEGWKNACRWVSPRTNEAGCDHSPVRGDKLCRYHRRDPKYCSPNSGLMSDKSEYIPSEEFERYKKPAPSPWERFMMPAAVKARAGGE